MVAGRIAARQCSRGHLGVRPAARRGRLLHLRRRPAAPGELIAATSRDDVGFAATGAYRPHSGRSPRLRRSIAGYRRNAVSIGSTSICLLRVGRCLLTRWPGVPAPCQAFWRRSQQKSGDLLTDQVLPRMKSQIFNVILDIIPSAEIIEPLHNRASIARAVFAVLNERIDDPPSITDLIPPRWAPRNARFT